MFPAIHFPFFTRNIISVFFLYGLSTFILGLAVLLKIRTSKLILVKALPWLSAYGIIHGIHEWLEMYEVIYPKLEFDLLFKAIISIAFAISTYLLLLFGILLLFYLTNNKKILLINAFLIIWIVLVSTIAADPISKSWFNLFHNFTRYFFYFTGSIISGIALIFQYKILKKQEIFKVAKYFLYTAIVFIVSAPFPGIVVEPTSLFLAKVINTSTFLDTFGLPVQFFRGLSSILITVFLIKGLDVFNLEEEQQIKDLRDRERSALDKSEKLAKQYSILYQQQKNISSTLQKSMLPPKIPSLFEYNLGVHYRSATLEASVGGDFYDIIEMPDGTLHIIIGDVSGKGIKTASETVNIKSLLRYFLLSGLNNIEAVTKLNKALFLEYKAAKLFTAIIVSYDNKKHKIDFINAGHPRPLIFKKGLERPFFIRKSSTALGVIENEKFTSIEFETYDLNLIILYTDGLLEARRDSKLFSEERIEELTIDLQRLSSQEISDNLVRAAINFSGNVIHDDILVLVLKKQGI